MIRLIALDLDGTLLDSHKNITQATISTVREASSHGVFIVPVTGRPLMAVPDIVYKMAPIRYVVATSGACIFDRKKAEIIHEDLLPCDLVVRILNCVRDTAYVPMVYNGGIGYAEPKGKDRAIEFAKSEAVKKYLRDNRRVTEDLLKFTKMHPEGMEKVTVNFDRDEAGNLIGLDEVLMLLSEFTPYTDIVYGGAINLEITNKTATKGNALRFLGKLLGIKTADMMAVGDSGNDEDMLRAAGVAVAMENATENVKKAAGFITKSNEEDGVSYAIRKFVDQDF